MGLYDYINGEQVKCFYRPVFSENGGVWHSGGRMICFKDGDEVPVETMYYKYPDNFMIFDHNSYFGDCNVHIIKDKKVFKTCTVTTMKDEYFVGNELVVSYYGSRIFNIKSVQEMKDYINDSLEFNKLRADIDKDTTKAMDNFMKCFRLTQSIENIKDKKDALNLITKENFEVVKLLDMNTFKDISTFNQLQDMKENLILNEDYINEFFKEFKELLNKQFYFLEEEHSKKSKKAKERLKPYKEEYDKKWFIEDEFTLEKEFGSYLEVIIPLFEDKDVESDIEMFDNKKRYISCRDRFNNFIKRNDNIKEKYIKWANLDQEEIQILDEILNAVL